MELKHQKTQNATSYQKRKNIYISFFYYNAHGCVIQYCMKRMQPGLYVTHSVQGERKTLKIDSNCEKKNVYSKLRDQQMLWIYEKNNYSYYYSKSWQPLDIATQTGSTWEVKCGFTANLLLCSVYPHACFHCAVNTRQLYLSHSLSSLCKFKHIWISEYYH